MSLIICPECKREVSSLAESCPNCGYKVNLYVENVRVTNVYNGKNKIVLGKTLTIFGLFFTVISFAINYPAICAISIPCLIIGFIILMVEIDKIVQLEEIKCLTAKSSLRNLCARIIKIFLSIADFILIQTNMLQKNVPRKFF
jgi:DNA-directed RNA polymerase subunit RPC12/RpoP